MSDELLRAAQGRAETRKRALAALERAGFAECVVSHAGEVARALLELVPRSAPLPQRLAAVSGSEVLAVVLHDGHARALESELVALAHDALSKAHAASLALTVRSLGPARALLAAHGVDEEASARLLEDPRGSLPHEEGEGRGEGLARATEGTATPEELEKVLLAFLGRLRFKTYGTRSPEEVAARLAGRLSRTLPAVARRIQAARAKLIDLAALEGRPAQVVERAAEVLGDQPGSLEPLRAQLAELARLGVPPARLELGSLPREGRGGGLLLDPSWTLEALGHGVLASGGSFEWKGQRAALARLDLAALPASEPSARADLLVIPVTEHELAAAQGFALEARAAGLRAELDPSGRNLRSALRAASRRGVPFAAILGEKEVREGLVQVKDLRREEQRTLARAHAPAEVRRALALPAEPRVQEPRT